MIYPGNTDYFDFSSAEMVAAETFCATILDPNWLLEMDTKK